MEQQIIKNLTFEELLPLFGVSGHVHLREGASTEEWPAQNPPVRIIQTDQSASLTFHWNAYGPLAKAFCGTWHFNVYFEEMGVGESGPQYHFHAPYKQGGNQRIHIIQPNSVSPGVYRVVVSMTLTANDGTPLPVAAFADLGMVQYYDD